MKAFIIRDALGEHVDRHAEPPPPLRASPVGLRPNEVMLASLGGSSGVQFVEFYDKGGSGETYPALFGPYGLAVYNAAGSKLGGQTLSAAGLSTAAAGNHQYLISTTAADTALGVTGNEKLTVPLPLTAGQACYTAGGTPYSCITWGCITHAVATSGTGPRRSR